MHLLFDDVRFLAHASSNVCYLIFCGWCEVWFIWNKQKQQSKCYTWTKSIKKMLGDRTKVMLDERGPEPGSGPVLSLLSLFMAKWCCTWIIICAPAMLTETELFLFCMCNCACFCLRKTWSEIDVTWYEDVLIVITTSD